MSIGPDSTKNRLIRRSVTIGTASNFVGQLVAFAVSLLLTPFLLRQLGPVVYGLWVLVGAMAAYGAILDFGVWGTIIKYVAEYHAQGDEVSARRLLHTMFYFYLGMCAFIGIIGFAIAPLFPHVFRLPPEQHNLARVLVILMSLATGLTLPCMISLAVLRGLQRYDIVNLIEVITSLLTAAATVAVLLLGGGVIGVVGVNIGGLFVMLILGREAVRRIAPELSIVRPLPGGAVHPLRDLQITRVAFVHSWPLFVQAVASRLQSRTDEITIGLFLPVSQVGAYSIARRLSETTQTLTRQFMKTLLPLTSQLHAEQDMARLRAVYKTGTRLALALILMLSALLFAFAGSILTVWVGAEYAMYANVVAILALANLIMTMRGCAAVVLQATARHRILAITSLSAGLANLGLSLLLVRPLGLPGIALGTVIPAALEYFCIILPYSLRVTRVSISEAWNEIFVPALLPLLPMLAVLYVLRASFGPFSLPVILAAIAVGLLTYVAVYLALADGVERRWLGDAILYLRRVRGAYFKWS